MSEQDQGTDKLALGLVWVLVALVVASVLTFAVRHSTHRGGSSAQGQSVDRLYFGVGDDTLPHDSADLLERFALAARSNSHVRVLISGFHDASGDAARNQALSQSRAERVRHALEANGVAPEQLLVAKLTPVPSGADPKEARRVELRLK